MNYFSLPIQHAILYVAIVTFLGTSNALADTGEPTPKVQKEKTSKEDAVKAKQVEEAMRKPSAQKATTTSPGQKDATKIKKQQKASEASLPPATATSADLKSIKTAVKAKAKSSVQTAATKDKEQSAKKPSNQPESKQATAAKVASDAEKTESTAGIQINKIILAKGVDEGKPVDPSTAFSRSDDDLFALIYLENPYLQDTFVRVSWERIDGPHWRGYALEVPAKRHYRTVARTAMGQKAPGQYKLVVSDHEGIVLEQLEFQINQ